MLMKSIFRFAALPLTLIVVIPAVALAAGSSRQVWATSTCTKEQYKPTAIVLACGDGNTFLQKLTWSSWTTTSAKGQGLYTYNTCRPSCAAGRDVSYSVNVALSKPQPCKQRAHKTFTNVNLMYPGRKPSHAVTRATISCPL
jgi:hypothetical protein